MGRSFITFLKRASFYLLSIMLLFVGASLYWKGYGVLGPIIVLVGIILSVYTAWSSKSFKYQ